MTFTKTTETKSTTYTVYICDKCEYKIYDYISLDGCPKCEHSYLQTVLDSQRLEEIAEIKKWDGVCCDCNYGIDVASHGKTCNIIGILCEQFEQDIFILEENARTTSCSKGSW